MNELAKQGWRVVAVSPNVAMGMGLVITLEREKRINRKVVFLPFLIAK